MGKLSFCLVCACAILAAPTGGSAALDHSKALDYEIIDLGPGEATAINNRNQVVGYLLTDDGHRHAFLWQNGVMTDLGIGADSIAWGINDSGRIVGHSSVGDGLDAAFVWQNGTMTTLPALPLGMVSYAYGINKNGRIVGESHFRASPGLPGEIHAIRWQAGSITDLGTLPEHAYSVAHAINNKAQAVGGSSTTDDYAPRHACLWQNGQVIDLGIPPGKNGSEAMSVNDSGWIVGCSYDLSETQRHAILWWNGGWSDLGSLGGAYGSCALDVNNNNQIVGFSTTFIGIQHAFLWQNGTMTDLGTAQGDTASSAQSINDIGWIVGNAAGRAVLWKPVPDVTITLAAKPAPVLVGNKLTYTIKVFNDGPGKAQNVVVTDSLPETLEFVSCTSTGGGVVGGSGNDRSVTFASIDEGKSKTITLVGRALGDLPDLTMIANTARVDHHGSSGDSASASAHAVTTPGGIRIRTSLVEGDPDPAPGSTGSWTYRVSLLSICDATEVSINSPSVSWAKVTGTELSTGKITKNPRFAWKIAGLEPDQAETLLVTVSGKVPERAQPGSKLALSGTWSITYRSGGTQRSVGPAPQVSLQVGEP